MKSAPQNPVLDQVPKNLLIQLNEQRQKLIATGKRVYDFGLGDPKEPTSEFIRDALRRGLPEISQYPSPLGTPRLRKACTDFVSRRFGVELDPDHHIVPAAGAKEAIFHLPLAFASRKSGHPELVEGRRKVVMPDPGYPTYETGARFAGLEPVKVPLTAENDFLLEPADVPEATLRETLIFWISYPHNPTGATAPRDYLERVWKAAIQHGFIVASDECYVDVYFDERPRSILEVGVENVIAIHSCSKRSGMTGYRSGFQAGDPDLIATLKRMRSHPGVASPDFVSEAAIAAWNDDAHASERREVFRSKRDRFLRFFKAQGIACSSRAALYLWARVPTSYTSLSYAERLLQEGIVVTPGTGFGAGEGYVRVALVPSLAECEEAIRIWAKVQ